MQKNSSNVEYKMLRHTGTREVPGERKPVIRGGDDDDDDDDDDKQY
jgi:hypothetical protein